MAVELLYTFREQLSVKYEQNTAGPKGTATWDIMFLKRCDYTNKQCSKSDQKGKTSEEEKKSREQKKNIKKNMKAEIRPKVCKQSRKTNLLLLLLFLLLPHRQNTFRDGQFL